MAEVRKYTILGRGEAYQEEIVVPRGGGKPPPIRPLDASRQLLLPQVQSLVRAVTALPAEQKLDEVLTQKLGESIPLSLDCGETMEPHEAQSFAPLAFVTPDEAQAALFGPAAETFNLEKRYESTRPPTK